MVYQGQQSLRTKAETDHILFLMSYFSAMLVDAEKGGDGILECLVYSSCLFCICNIVLVVFIYSNWTFAILRTGLFIKLRRSLGGL